MQLTICPPMDAGGCLRYTPQYHRQLELPVHLPERDISGTFEHGLAFDDLVRCNVYSHKGGLREKCLPIPLWALNDSMTRAVVLRYMEKRTNSKPIGTERERLVRVLRKMKDSSARLTAQLDRMCGEYVAHLECDSPWCLRRRQVLDLQIKVLDGRLIFCARPDLFYSVVIGFYRTRLTSPEIGDKHGISKECVRKILSRMNASARKLGYDAPKKVVASPEVRRMRKLQRESARAARREERRIRAEQQEAARQYRMTVTRKPSADKPLADAAKRYLKGPTRARWAMEGRCTRCGKTKDRTDRVNCKLCRQLNAEYMRRREDKKAAR